MKALIVLVLLALAGVSSPLSAETIQGRWKLTAAEDLRADGSVARHPWGEHPVGWIVVDGGFLYLQIMSSDVPSLVAGKPPGEQMAAAALSSYISYSGPVTVDEAAGKVTFTPQAAWRPDYVGSKQERNFRFEGSKMYFGLPLAGGRGGESLTRRLTLVRVQ